MFQERDEECFRRFLALLFLFSLYQRAKSPGSALTHLSCSALSGPRLDMAATYVPVLYPGGYERMFRISEDEVGEQLCKEVLEVVGITKHVEDFRILAATNGTELMVRNDQHIYDIIDDTLVSGPQPFKDVRFRVRHVLTRDRLRIEESDEAVNTFIIHQIMEDIKGGLIPVDADTLCDLLGMYIVLKGPEPDRQHSYGALRRHLAMYFPVGLLEKRNVANLEVKALSTSKHLGERGKELQHRFLRTLGERASDVLGLALFPAVDPLTRTKVVLGVAVDGVYVYNASARLVPHIHDRSMDTMRREREEEAMKRALGSKEFRKMEKCERGGGTVPPSLPYLQLQVSFNDMRPLKHYQLLYILSWGRGMGEITIEYPKVLPSCTEEIVERLGESGVDTYLVDDPRGFVSLLDEYASGIAGEAELR